MQEEEQGTQRQEEQGAASSGCRTRENWKNLPQICRPIGSHRYSKKCSRLSHLTEMLIQIDWMWNWNKTGVRHGAGWVLLSNCHLMQHGPQLELDNFLMCGTMWLSNVSNELAMLLRLQDLPRSWMQTLEAIAAPPHWVWEEVWDNENVWELQWVGCQLVRGPRRIWADYVTPCHSAITAL